MEKQLRQQFNSRFSETQYLAYLQEIDALAPDALDFKVAETPIFIPKDFKQKMLDACETIVDVLLQPEVIEATNRSIPEKYSVPNESSRPEMLVFDFGICKNESGELIPQLIEMQGFPSLFAYQYCLDQITREYAAVPDNYSAYLNNYNNSSYAQLLADIIIGDTNIEQVVLLEIFPEKQKTRIDFACTKTLLNIRTVCLTTVFAEGNQLFYNYEGNKIQIKKIFNRVIFDDLEQLGLTEIIDLKKSYEVEWITHPNWFYRISKFTLPFIDSLYVPDTYFLSELTQPLNWSEYVLKPLFSYAGMGIVIDVTQADIDAITDPEHWIVQKKVQYAPVIETLDEPAKAEIRLFYFWKKEWERPVAVHNLARLSKGKMIGTRYNEGKTWVGGTIAYFEK